LLLALASRLVGIKQWTTTPRSRSGEEEEQLLATLRTVDEEIEELLAKEEDLKSNRRFMTTFDIINQKLIVGWEDPADLPKTKTTFDIHQESLTVPYSDPSLLPKQPTTFDLAVNALTKDHE
jgi:hypothetical protein